MIYIKYNLSNTEQVLTNQIQRPVVIVQCVRIMISGAINVAVGVLQWFIALQAGRASVNSISGNDVLHHSSVLLIARISPVQSYAC